MIERRRAGPWILSLCLGVFAASPVPAQEAFSHSAHQGLFPLCTGCHVVGDDGSVRFPSQASCARCHDGEQQAPVDWTPPGPSLRLDHRFHADAAVAQPLCGDCHGAGDRTAVGTVRSGCAGCHGEHHAAEIRCRACHGESPQAGHTVVAHAGCGDAGCHDPGTVSGIRFDRELCLLCHTTRVDHKPGRRCGRCHAVGQPGG